jgi:hypothetical protein
MQRPRPSRRRNRDPGVRRLSVGERAFRFERYDRLYPDTQGGAAARYLRRIQGFE